MLKLIKIFLLIIFVINITKACKIQIKIRSNTENKFKIHIYIPSIKQKTEEIIFNGKSQKKVKPVSNLFFFNIHFTFFNLIHRKKKLFRLKVMIVWIKNGLYEHGN